MFSHKSINTFVAICFGRCMGIKKAGQFLDLLKYQIKPLLANANKKNLILRFFDSQVY